MQRSGEIFLIDIDDTLLPWETPKLESFESICALIYEITDFSKSEISESIKQAILITENVENNDLINNMPILKNIDEEIKRKILIEYEIIKKTFVSKNKICFEGIDILLELLATNHKILIALTNAPLDIAMQRLQESGLERFFSLVIGQNKKELKLKNLSKKPKNIISNQKKPNVDLCEKLGLTEKEIMERCVIIGDSDDHDGIQGQKYGLLHYNCQWENNHSQTQEILRRYLPEDLKKEGFDTKLARIDAYEKVNVFNPKEIALDLRKRELIKEIINL